MGIWGFVILMMTALILSLIGASVLAGSRPSRGWNWASVVDWPSGTFIAAPVTGEPAPAGAWGGGEAEGFSSAGIVPTELPQAEPISKYSGLWPGTISGADGRAAMEVNRSVAAIGQRRFREQADRSEIPDLHTQLIPDLHTQFESLLDCVWRCERIWRLEHRLEHAYRAGQ